MKVHIKRYNDKEMNYQLIDTHVGAWVETGDINHHNANLKKALLCLPLTEEERVTKQYDLDHWIAGSMLVADVHVWNRGKAILFEGFVGVEVDRYWGKDSSNANFNKEQWLFIINNSTDETD